MKKTLLFLSMFICLLHSQELKIKADYFESDEKKGISLFRGNVHIKKGFDEINASKVTIYTDKQRHPVKYIAQGDVSFTIEDQHAKRYKGKAQKVVYEPLKQEYRFYTDVFLKQIGDKKEIRGDEVVFSAKSGKAYAKGVEDNPVIMIFDIKKEEEQ